MAKPTIKASQDRVKRESKAQHDRSPMLAVRIPRSLYRALKAAAKEDKRTLADWLRLNLPKLVGTEADDMQAERIARAILDAPLPQRKIQIIPYKPETITVAAEPSESEPTP